MSLEKDINQTKFRNDYQKATLNIIYTCNWLQQQVKFFLEPMDITSQQFNILRILRGQSPLSTLQIRERMLDKMSDTSRLVERLIKKGLVIKQSCQTDKRLVDVTITEKGLALLASLDTDTAGLDNLLSNLSQEESLMLNSLLDKIRG
ncbi:MAG: MarR family transcriptional regulator [Pedobacter sp.]|nr:MarR family transcriptional regulator [Chitinophagaceae bacterium]